MGQDIRSEPDQVLAPIRMVRQPRQAGLPRAPFLLSPVFATQGRLRLNPQGVRRLPTHLQRAWHANRRRLARVLQQPGCCPVLGSVAKDEGVLHQPGCGHLQGRSLPPGGVEAVHLAQNLAKASGLHPARVVSKSRRSPGPSSKSSRRSSSTAPRQTVRCHNTCTTIYSKASASVSQSSKSSWVSCRPRRCSCTLRCCSGTSTTVSS